MFRYFSLFLAALFGQIAAPAQAEVVVTFYSHDFGDRFPHAFVTLKGTVDSTGERVDTNYGFTAVSISPAMLLGSVKGMIQTKDAKYVADSNPHFSVRLSDAEYLRFMSFVERWRTMPGKSYNLNKRNCVHFAMEAAALVGLSVKRDSKLFKKPKSFILEMMAINQGVKLLY